MCDSWRRVVVALAGTVGVVRTPTSAWAQDESGPGDVMVAVGAPVDEEKTGACIAREREGIWDGLARRGVGYGLATQWFIWCAEASR